MKVMSCIDFSEYTTKVVEWAATFAKNYKADLLLLYIIKDSVKKGNEIYTFEESAEDVKEKLNNKKLEIEKNFPDINITSHITGGHVPGAIIEFAEKNRIDHIVLGKRGGGGFKEMLLGSVAQKVVVYAGCPVTVIK